MASSTPGSALARAELVRLLCAFYQHETDLGYMAKALDMEEADLEEKLESVMTELRQGEHR